jgi:hypothetical protein
VLAAVGEPGEAADQQDAVVVAGADADRRVAARPEPGDDGALGAQLDERFAIGQIGRSSGGGRTGVIAGLERERALPGRRGQRPQAEAEAGLAAAAEPLETGRGEDDPVDLAVGALPQPRIDVASQLDDVEVGTDGEQLRAAADARGSDPRPFGNLGDRPARPDPDVGGVRTRRDAGEREALGQLTRQVLGAVDGEVDVTVEKRPLDLADEPRLVVAPCRGRTALVAGGADDDELGAVESRGDRSRLRQREGAATGADPQPAQGAQSPVRSLRLRSGVTSAPAPSGSVPASSPNSSRNAATCW